MTLRPYQRECVDAILRARADGQSAQLITLPTGTGKTVIFVHLAARAKRPVLVIAHRDELLTQAADKAVAAGIDTAAIGKVKAGRSEWERPFVVASVQSLWRRLGPIPRDRFGLIIIDECHHSAAATYRRVVDHFEPSLLLGVTATADRGDGRGLADVFGARPVYSYSIRDAITDGWLVRIRQWSIATTTSLDDVHRRCGDFVIGELSQTINTPERNRLIAEAWRDRAAGRPTVVFGVDVQHAYDLAKAFAAVGVRAAAIHGNTPDDERRRLLDDLHEHRIDVLCNCALLTEGVDIPPISCVITARPTQSRSLYAQCVGRGLRPHDGKTDCLILDISDNCNRHKLVTVGDLLGVEKRNCAGADVLDEAEREEAERQQRRARLATETREVDPFPSDDLDGYTPTQHWHGSPATERQIALLRRFGIVVDELTAGAASFLIDREIARRNALPPTPKQVAFLRHHGIDARNMSRRAAGKMIGEIKAEVAA